ncbi:aminoglycoside phosphotransferase family protein [Streptomyces sp. NPDC021093]|uniref:aminoglycoside phosphotransferase family protein n=1 Tax=Streptomyces sp. NPDC021093 TaxID=3365112 RepID=UPI003794C238
MQQDAVEVPARLVEEQIRWNGSTGRAWIEQLPAQAADYLARWDLRRDGPALHGAAALVLPVVREDRTPAVLKLQLRDEESEGEAPALRAWAGRRGVVALLDADDRDGTLLLERLDESRSLGGLPDAMAGVQVIAESLARLTADPAPPGIRRLGDIAAGLLDDAPELLPELADPEQRRLLERCAAAVREVAGEPGDRLLHWDLHEENVLAPREGSPRSEPWVVIDPKPLAGDPGFDLFPAIKNRFEADQVLRRFDLMSEVLGLERERAAAWTLGRVLQDCLWELEDGEDRMPDTHVVVAEALLTLRT